ncbi:MAG: EcsC family protein [Anaerofustis sp.]
MSDYEERCRQALILWKKDMLKDATAAEKGLHRLQCSARNLIPEPANRMMTDAVKNMTRAAMSVASVGTDASRYAYTLCERDRLAREKIDAYRKNGMISGAATGYGGCVLSLADFPILLSIKMKLLSEIGACYGFDGNDPQEQLFQLLIFQLAFSRREKRKELFHRWIASGAHIGRMFSDEPFDWTGFREEYCDYIDLAKLLQMVPGFGAVIGAVSNDRLVLHLGKTAVQAYHYRLLSKSES